MSAVTVVVPTHDRRAVLAETLRSLLAQRDVDLRVVVVDDGSRDRTDEWVASRSDPRVHVVRRAEAGGEAAARNTGLEHVETPWVAFCDDDDLWAPTKLAAQLAAVNAGAVTASAGEPGGGTSATATAVAPPRWSCVGVVCFDERKRIVRHQPAPPAGDLLGALRRRNIIPGGSSGVLASTALVRELGGFDATLPASPDWDMWIRLASRSPLAVVDQPLVGYRVWSGNLSRRLPAMQSAFDEINRRYGSGIDPAESARHRADFRRFLAKQQLQARQRGAAARSFAAVAVARRRPSELLRVPAALAAPGVVDRVGTSRDARRVPPAWRAQAGAWLAELELLPLP